jgi:[ribosomal protein S18]-alanine N-acetyltransferase
MSAVLAAPAVEFAPMRAEDLDTVVAAERRIYEFPWTRGNFADSLAAGYTCSLVYQDGLLAGYGVVMIALDEAHLLNISILPERRHCGLGSRLLEEFSALARGRGATRMLLEVRRSNRAGRGFYDRHGFLTIGVRRGYYAAEQGREDAIVMAKDL